MGSMIVDILSLTAADEGGCTSTLAHSALEIPHERVPVSAGGDLLEVVWGRQEAHERAREWHQEVHFRLGWT